MTTTEAKIHKVAHHFESARQEESACKLGMWLFLCTEILMFGGLFVGYVIYKRMYPAIFLQGATFLDWKLGALNTVVLLVSSLTMALSIYYIQKGKNNKAILCLCLTLLCGFIFMGVKYLEYSHKLHLGLAPGALFSYTETPTLEGLPLYFSFYYCMTGLHGLHVLVGMLLIFWMIILAGKKQFNTSYYTPLECVGLFWHLVDLIWIYLFPLLYLVE
ncbi:MAG: cytochrome c oxidase subunit 3 family protein [Bdellovibrionales bacterium]|nr:cytochrome c oxidase subunit 3 family protein [Bdellovibrionales bacterium]